MAPASLEASPPQVKARLSCRPSRAFSGQKDLAERRVENVAGEEDSANNEAQEDDERDLQEALQQQLHTLAEVIEQRCLREETAAARQSGKQDEERKAHPGKA